MPYLNEKKGPDHEPLLLMPHEMDDPYGVIESFYWDYNLGELREIIANAFEACMTTDLVPFDDPEERSVCFLRKYQIEKLFEAAWLIALQRERETKENNK